MTLDAFLAQLECVRQRNSSRWSARCPAHGGQSKTTLSVSEGDQGLLLRCWAGCTIAEICASLGIQQRDLFYDSTTNHRRTRPAPKPARVDRVKLAFSFDLAALDLRLRAERIIEAGKHLNIAVLTDEELDRALDHIAHAYVDQERAELFEHVADTLRMRDFTEGNHGR